MLPRSIGGPAGDRGRLGAVRGAGPRRSCGLLPQPWDAPSPTEAFLLALASVLLATGLMTALGRSSSVDLETQGSRYGLIVATSQAVTLILFCRPLTQVIMRLHVRPLCMNMAIIALSLFLLSEQALATVMVHKRTEELANAKTHLCSGDLSPKYLETIYFADTDHAALFVEAAKTHNWYCDSYVLKSDEFSSVFLRFLPFGDGRQPTAQ
jgi:hypothetical protein